LDRHAARVERTARNERKKAVEGRKVRVKQKKTGRKESILKAEKSIPIASEAKSAATHQEPSIDEQNDDEM
jgi:hypothetical protein